MYPAQHGLISEAEYQENLNAIHHAQAVVDRANAVNEAGRRKYEETQALLLKIEEGKRAEARLQALLEAGDGSTKRPLTIAGPPTQQIPLSAHAPAPMPISSNPVAARIEEVPDYVGPATTATASYSGETSQILNPYPFQNSGVVQPHMPPVFYDHQHSTSSPYPHHPYGYTPTHPHGQSAGTSTAWQSQQPRERAPAPKSRPRQQPRQTNVAQAQPRQPLPMQPVARPVQQTRPQQPSPHVNPSTTVTQPSPVQQHTVSQHVASTSVMSAVPVAGFMSNAYPSTSGEPYAHSISLPTSSLAAALDMDVARDGSDSAALHDTSKGPITDPISVGTIASTSQEWPTTLSVQERPTTSDNQGRPSNSRVTAPAIPPSSISTSGPVPRTDAPIPRGTIINDIGSSSNRPNPGTSPSSRFFSSADWIRLVPSVLAWLFKAQPNSALPLGPGPVSVYMDPQRTLFFRFPDPRRPGQFVNLPIPLEALKTTHLPSHATQQQTKPRSHGAPAQSAPSQPNPRTLAKQPFTPPSNTQAPAAVFIRPYTPQHFPGITPSTPATLPVRPSSTTIPNKTSQPNGAQKTPLASSVTNVRRTPAQADKRTLAKDILRALGQKRRQTEVGSDTGATETPRKRHAPERVATPAPLDAQPAPPSSPTPTQVNDGVPSVAPLPAPQNGVPRPPSQQPPQSSESEDTHPTSMHMTYDDHDSDYPMHVPEEASASLPTTPAPHNEAAPQSPTQPSGLSQTANINQESKEGVDAGDKPSQASAISQAEPVQPANPYLGWVSLPRPTNAPRSHHAHPLEQSSFTAIQPTPVAQPPITRPASPAALQPPVRSSSDTRSTSIPERKEKTPLFIPSPSPEPVRHTSDEPATSEGRRWKKEQPFYILVPPLPDYVKKYRAQWSKKRHSREASGATLDADGRASSAGSEDIPDIDPTSNGFVNGDAEREAVLLSCSRLCHSPCKWSGCTAVLGSAEKLIMHFAAMHKPDDRSKNLYICMWQQCGKREFTSSRLFYHLRSHAIVPLRCAYDGCDESFRTARQLAKHHQSGHPNDPEKMSASPLIPMLEPPSPIPREPIPSYLIVPVQQPAISRDRHHALGHSVLFKISADSATRTKRYNAASKLLKSNSDQQPQQPDNDPYDFLNRPSNHFSATSSQPARIRQMDDLESGEVSEYAHYDGLMLWGDDDPDEENVGLLRSAEDVQGIPQPPDAVQEAVE